MIPVKICGITSIADAELAMNLGAAAIGLICYEKSPRYVTPEQAAKISSVASHRAKSVGVFVNEAPHAIRALVEKMGLDWVQLSGDEPARMATDLGVPVIKAFHVGPGFDPAKMTAYRQAAWMLDTYSPAAYGGTGENFAWDKIDRSSITRPLVLSGGLTPGNISAAISALNPNAVDVNSGVEAEPGKKDRKKLEQLFAVLESIPYEGDNLFA